MTLSASKDRPHCDCGRFLPAGMDGLRCPACVGRAVLSPRLLEVLAAASDGVPLAVVAVRLGTTREQVSARLSEAYRGLGVGWMPRGEKRGAAVAVARRAGLIPAADLASPPGRAPGRA